MDVLHRRILHLVGSPALMQVFALLQQLDDVEVKVSGALSVEIEVLF